MSARPTMVRTLNLIAPKRATAAGRLMRTSVRARAAHPDAPAVVVQHPLLGGRAHVDLLPRVLADIADVEIAGRAVPRKAPRVAQPVAGDLPLRPRLVHIQPEELAQANAQVLCAVPGVAARAAIAHPYIQHPVRPELELATVVVRVGLPHEQQAVRRPGQPDRPIRAVLDDVRVPVEVRVVD